MAVESRVAAVTGANKGIGLAIGHTLYSDACSNADWSQSATWP